MNDGIVSVYRYHDANGRLLYVGVTARNIRRGHEHAETKKWWTLCTGSVIEHFATRELALQREEQLIRRYAPPYNTVHNDKKLAAQRLYEANMPWRSNVLTEVEAPEVTEFDHEERLAVHQRRVAWYELSVEDRRAAPCIRCGRDSRLMDPECADCIASPAATLKQRRREWMALSKEEKRVAPCVRCGQRPGANGPECAVCHPERSAVAKGKSSKVRPPRRRSTAVAGASPSAVNA